MSAFDPEVVVSVVVLPVFDELLADVLDEPIVPEVPELPEVPLAPIELVLSLFFSLSVVLFIALLPVLPFVAPALLLSLLLVVPLAPGVVDELELLDVWARA
ncbi:MAG TPA: hypothetical protein VKD22_13905 [Ramlibacter sp.]|nr:hypothetical protein [Ramlibacter sp.]